MTPEQQTALRIDIIAKALPGQPLEALLAARDWQNIAAYYNAENSPTNVWRPDAPKSKVFGAIVWKNLTQADAPDATAIYTNRVLASQSRQMNLDILLPPTADTLPGDEVGFRQGLQDALTDIPAGVGGALLGGGWGAVQNVLRRPGTPFEVMFSTVDGNANKSAVYGQRIDGIDCNRALVSDSGEWLGG